MDPHSDPDPAPCLAIFVRDLQIIFFVSFLAYYFLKLHLHHFSKLEIHIEVTKQ
jgi:hypothetical protein